MRRAVIAATIMTIAIALCFWAWIPALVTYAQIPPEGIEYSLDDPHSIEIALARSASIGRESMRAAVWSRLEVLSGGLILTSAVTCYLVIRDKHAA